MTHGFDDEIHLTKSTLSSIYGSVMSNNKSHKLSVQAENLDEKLISIVIKRYARKKKMNEKEKNSKLFDIKQISKRRKKKGNVKETFP